MDLTQKLKQKVINCYRKFGDNKAILLKGKRSYTGDQIANQIENETKLGFNILNNLLTLTIDLLSRDKINYNEKHKNENKTRST